MSRPDWIKDHQRVVDQRGVELPPTWIAQERRNPVGDELGQSVHISGRKRQVADRVAELLGGASQMVAVSTFLLADRDVEDALMAAAQRGVRVYVMLASEARLGREESDGEFDRRVLSEHKEMLNRLAGHVLFRSAPHFHAKVIVIDPQSNPRGILLTANLTREALERNEEIAVDLTQQEARDAAALLGWAMWETAEHEMVDPTDRFRAVKPMGSLETPVVELPATTPESTALRHRALELVDGARDRLVVASFGWDAEHPLVRRLLERAKEGLEVVVLARLRPSVMPALVRLCEAGATVYGFRWLHAKAIWSDQGEALVMSANLQPDGLDHGFELGLELSGARANELHGRLQSWATAAHWKLEHGPSLGDVRGTAKVWSDRECVDIEVVPSLEVSLGEHIARSADDLSVEPPALPSNGALPRPAHELVCTWTVAAPTLHRKAKEVFRPAQGKKKRQPYEPPVFKEGGRMVVVVRQTDELQVAKRLVAELSADAVVVRAGGDR